MCGFAGFLSASSIDREESFDLARSMADALIHRGPDDRGEWIDSEAGIAFGFRRLSILDLSQAGHQPMVSASGRYVIIYNGEVYNFERLRRQLEAEGRAPRFRGHSDTEVMLAAIEAWGVEQAVQRFNGMFAFALWDRRERLLHLVRDRAGVKPLYYGRAGNAFLFGSELKALRRHPAFQDRVDRKALTLYMRFMCVPAPLTIYQNVGKLEPGSILTVTSAKLDSPLIRSYWPAGAIAERAAAQRFRGTEEEAADELDSILRDSIRLRMIADVPIGVFLSGGVDSSTVTAIMQNESSIPVKSFSIGFREEVFNEAVFARRVAAHLGTDHTELYVTAQDALNVIPRLPHIYDEPFADSSQIPTYLLSALTRQKVTVSLSGDGGDELFGGYGRYTLGPPAWQRLKYLPRGMRNPLLSSLTRISPESWDKIFSLLRPVLPAVFRREGMGVRMHKLPELMKTRSSDGLYLGMMSQWWNPEAVVLGGSDEPELFSGRNRLRNYTERLMFLDFINYLPDDLLVKVDRASMAVSLESREPLLDHRLVEFAWSLPLSMKLSRDQTKRLLRKVLYRYVPAELIERPKMGFGVPLGEWLRGPLRDWAESLLSQERLQHDGFFHPGIVRRKWMAQLTGKENWENQLWSVLMFQAWLDETAGRLSPEVSQTPAALRVSAGGL